MKRIRRIALVLAGLWLFLALASLYSIYLARGIPDWYQAPAVAPADQAAAANQSDQKLADLFSYASDVAAAQRRRFNAAKGGNGATEAPIAAKTINISELEANAFADKWGGLADNGDSEGISQYLANGRLALLDNRLLIAGKLRNVRLLTDRVASIEFRPVLDGQDRLSLPFNRVYIGQLPVPSVVTARLRSQLHDMLADELPRWQKKASVFPDGLANADAAAFVWGRLFLAGLDGRTVDPVLLLPCDAGNIQRMVPVRVEGLTIMDQRMTATIRPLNETELAGLSAQIHQAYDAGADAQK